MTLLKQSTITSYVVWTRCQSILQNKQDGHCLHFKHQCCWHFWIGDSETHQMWMPPLKTTTATESRQHSAKGHCLSRVEHWNGTYSFTTWISLPVSQIFFFSTVQVFSLGGSIYPKRDSRDSHYLSSWGWYSCWFHHPLRFLILFHRKLRMILPTLVYTKSLTVQKACNKNKVRTISTFLCALLLY